MERMVTMRYRVNQEDRRPNILLITCDQLRSDYLGCYGAEFLNNPSPVGLRIFFLPTCVGLRYGRLTNTCGFSRHRPSTLPY